jgi:microcystin-dependent protein
MSNEPFLSEIQLFSFGFPPKGWAFCNGQILPISQNQALFALLGTTYGGNGQTTFALPDLRGRAPMHEGGGHFLGESSGAETVTVATSQLPAHTHPIDVSGMTLTRRAQNAAANQRTPVDAVPAVAAGPDLVYSQAAADANMSSAGVVISGTVVADNVGGGQAHENRQPFLALNYCIALVGIFPSQNP